VYSEVLSFHDLFEGKHRSDYLASLYRYRIAMVNAWACGEKIHVSRSRIGEGMLVVANEGFGRISLFISCSDEKTPRSGRADVVESLDRQSSRKDYQ